MRRGSQPTVRPQLPHIPSHVVVFSMTSELVVSYTQREELPT